METTRVGKRGTFVIPVKLRQRFNIKEGDLFLAEEREDGILLRPAIAVPVEIYTPERKAEFFLNNAVTREDYDAACEDIRAMGLDPATTLHDVRWGEYYRGNGIDDFVWVFMISGAAPASHFINGYAGASCERQGADFFRLGGATLKGISKPGEIVWSRVFVENGEVHADLGRATVVELPLEETQRRWSLTSPEWPIMSAVLHGVSRDQFMARHRANHIIVVYAPSAEVANKALAAKAAMMNALGIKVHLCGL